MSTGNEISVSSCRALEITRYVFVCSFDHTGYNLRDLYCFCLLHVQNEINILIIADDLVVTVGTYGNCHEGRGCVVC
jgi:hypothetical protein